MPSLDDAVQTAVQQAQSGRMDLAIPAFQAVLRQDPAHVEANKFMAIAMISQRPPNPQAGMAHIDRAISAAPGRADLYHLKGEASAWMGNIGGAIQALRRSVELNPNAAQSRALLATCLLEVRDLDSAEHEYLETLRIQPNHAEARTNYATILTATARPDEAVKVLRDAARDHPQHPGVLTNYCVALNYADGIDPQETIAAHRQYGRILAAMPGAPMDPLAFSVSRDPERRLRVGLLSPDLIDHSVSYFTRALLEPRDRAAFEYVVYSLNPRADTVTARLRQSADHWRDMAGPGFNGRPSDQQLIDQLRADHVDILIEFSGQTHGNRLAALRLRGAPVQATYIGYPNTTGLPTIDYRFVDSLTDPPGAESFATERLIRLDPCFLCYSPRDDAPPPSQPPHLSRGHITFGSFNSLKKLTPDTIALWCRLIREVPGSRLVIKSGAAFAESAKATLRNRIASLGVESSRFDLLEKVESKAGHLDTYGLLDIALDTYPYHGTTTTCEALWQGVPVVSLVGRTHASRVGLSLLSTVGLADLAASTPEQFLAAAKALAADHNRLSTIRSSLRDTMRRSLLCDAPTFARRFESALRGMWRDYCKA